MKKFYNPRVIIVKISQSRFSLRCVETLTRSGSKFSLGRIVNLDKMHKHPWHFSNDRIINPCVTWASRHLLERNQSSVQLLIISSTRKEMTRCWNAQTFSREVVFCRWCMCASVCKERKAIARKEKNQDFKHHAALSKRLLKKGKEKHFTPKSKRKHQ